jgi:hypothetical protein
VNQTIISGLRIDEDNNPTANSYVSMPVIGDGILHRASGKHTLYVHTMHFTGNVVIEATMGADSNIGPYLTIPITNTMYGNSIDTLNFSNTTTHDFYTILGQYTYIRANVQSMSAGILASITLTI